MKYRFVFPLLAVVALNSCQRSKTDHAQAEKDRAAVEAAADALEAERARIQAAREDLEAEKEELRLQREADLAAKEQELAGLESSLAMESEEARLAAEALAAEQDALALREQALNEVELEQAGTTVIADWTPDEPEVMQEPVADYSLFYDELEPHGDWFETPDYGYVYQPTVVIQNRSWRPYTNGRWVCSNLGWTWRSDEPFGWATFHYGRWALLSGRGWCWVPGSEWAPSWCAWRQGGGHTGWAPLPPETLAYSRRGWGSNTDVELGIASSWFNFVENRFMANPLAKHCLPVSRNRHFIGATRGCTNIQFQQNRIISGGPSYADLYRAVNQPWPVRLLDLDSVGGFGRGRHVNNHRNGIQRGNSLQVFAPSINAPWNSGLRPNRVADTWNNVKVVRAENGMQQTWSRRLADARERQQENAQRWAQKSDDLKAARERQLQINRGKVAEAQSRIRENIARQASLRDQRKADALAQANGRPATVPDRNEPRNDGPVASVPDRGVPSSRGPGGGAEAGITPGRNAPRDGGATANAPGIANARGSEGGRLPRGVTRPGESKPPSQPVVPKTTPDKTSPSANDRLAEIRRQQQEARQRVTRNAEEAKARVEETRARAEQARNARSRPEPSGRGDNTAAASMKERLEQARQQREQQAAEKASQQAQAQAQLREKLRQQQEKVRASQEQAKADQQRRMQEQQAKVRAAQEQAKQAQADRARQQAEQARQKEMADRQAAEQAARQKQAAAQRAAEQRAQQQAEMARRQEEANRAAQEKARENQERAREAAEQRARQQEQNQQRIREAQEKMREKFREQQERNKDQSQRGGRRR